MNRSNNMAAATCCSGQRGLAKQSKTKQFRCGVRLKEVSGGYQKSYVEEPFVFVSATLPVLEARLAAIRRQGAAAN